MSGKCNKPKACKVTKIPPLLPLQSYTHTSYTVKRCHCLFSTPWKAQWVSSFVVCKLAMAGILAEDEGLWHYTTASYRFRSLHWSKCLLSLSSHLQCNKAAPFSITGVNFHTGILQVKPEENQKTHQSQTTERGFCYNTLVLTVTENYGEGTKSWAAVG